MNLPVFLITTTAQFLLCSGVLPTNAIQCCQNANCTKTCTTDPFQACVRRACSPEERKLSRTDICPVGCDRQQIEYRVSNRQIEVPYLGVPNADPNRFITFCKDEKCNKQPSLLESCEFAPKSDFEIMKCGCTKEGMRGTFVASLLSTTSEDSSEVDYSSFCKAVDGPGFSRVCKFQDIKTHLQRLHRWDPSWEDSFACNYKQTGDHATVAYGCDIMLQTELTGCRPGQHCPVTRLFSYRHGARGRHTTRLQILCNDGPLCNTKIQTATFEKQANSCHSGEANELVSGAPGGLFNWGITLGMLFVFTIFQSGFSLV